MSHAQEYLLIIAVFIIGSIVLSILNKICHGRLRLKKNHPLNLTSAKYQQDYVNGLSGIITGPASLLSNEIYRSLNED
ncbi:hypothetical protein GCM10011332_08950 [Terasakiella brassicae]|uniref:Uncharacterized protein n=1 Tax=Terasakiella brassicae TaxID=1634917 RepID=A0A917F8F0_9PROT|nr:hypothetical protein [Terasakiella brassicae]GGF57682.1 hypothetical protein GCM10011332_08950 [Terasakiella brassicae]